VAHKALLAGSRTVQVDTAHTSQACSHYGYSSADNRPDKGLLFVCQECHLTLHADLVGVRNVALRMLLVRQERGECGCLVGTSRCVGRGGHSCAAATQRPSCRGVQTQAPASSRGELTDKGLSPAASHAVARAVVRRVRREPAVPPPRRWWGGAGQQTPPDTVHRTTLHACCAGAPPSGAQQPLWSISTSACSPEHPSALSPHGVSMSSTSTR